MAGLQPQRKKRFNRRRARKAALTLFFLLLMALGVYFFLRSGLFAVREIAVTGSAQVSADTVRALSGIKLGQNIWDINLAQAEERIGHNPWIKAVTVRRQLPDIVRIDISERRPMALIAYETAYVEIDEAGVALDISPALINRELPLITGLTVTRVVLGQQVAAPGLLDGIRAVLPLSQDVIRQISEVNIGADRALTMILLNGVRVFLGQPDDTLEKRVALLPGILDDVARRGTAVDYIDLRYNGNPVSGKGDPAGGTK